MDVTTGPLVHWPQRIHHSWVGSRMGARYVCVSIEGGSYTTTLGRMRRHGCIRGIALRTELIIKTKTEKEIQLYFSSLDPDEVNPDQE